MDANYSFELGQNDSWIMVNTNDGSRSPQYNGDNEPSGHKANASTSPSRQNSFSFEEIKDIGQDLPPALSQKTISNGSSRTKTSGTATLTGDQVAALHAQYGCTGGSSRAKETLTQSNLHRHEHLDAVNVFGWVVDSGSSLRFAQYQIDPTLHECPVAERSIPSPPGSGTCETSGPQSSAGAVDIFAIGAWTDGPIEAITNYSRPSSE